MAAVGGQFGIARDKAVGLLWPNDAEDRARNSLRQRLFLARRAIDEKPLLRQDPDYVQIASENLAVDLWAFETAVATGKHERAAELYLGPFLDGFVIPGLGDFDRWLETHRSRLHHMALNSMEQAARSCAAAGNTAGAVMWFRQLAMLEPLSSRIALELISALAAAGDTPAGLNHARLHEATVLRDLEIPPDPAFMRFVRQLESRAREGRGPEGQSLVSLAV